MSAISPPLLNLLKTLMADAVLQDFYLVGGTGLALHLGHRVSTDIDLFSCNEFDSFGLSSYIEKKYPSARLIHEQNTVRAMIDGIKTEFLAHEYAMLEAPNLIDGIRVASLKDIAAFKLNAIAGRGSKKDFWDLSALLDNFTLPQMITFFQTKYPASDNWHLIKSLTYFEDAEIEQIDIIDLKGITWQSVKDRVTKALKESHLLHL